MGDRQAEQWLERMRPRLVEIRNASLPQAVAIIMTLQFRSRGVEKAIRTAFQDCLQRHRWVGSRCAAELSLISDVVRKHNFLMDLQTLLLIFRGTGFKSSVTPELLAVMRLYLFKVKYTHDQATVSQLRNTVASHIGGHIPRVPGKGSLARPIKQAVQFWDQRFGGLKESVGGYTPYVRYKEELKWMCQAHMQSFLFGINLNRTLDSLDVLASCLEDADQYTYDATFQAFDVLNVQGSPGSLMEGVFPNRRFIEPRTSKVHTALITKVVSISVSALNVKSGKGSELPDFSLRSRVDFMEFLSQDAISWARFAYWFLRRKEAGLSPAKLSSEEAHTWRTMDKLAQLVAASFRAASKKIYATTCPLSTVYKCQQVGIGELEALWDLLAGREVTVLKSKGKGKGKEKGKDKEKTEKKEKKEEKEDKEPAPAEKEEVDQHTEGKLLIMHHAIAEEKRQILLSIQELSSYYFQGTKLAQDVSRALDRYQQLSVFQLLEMFGQAPADAVKAATYAKVSLEDINMSPLPFDILEALPWLEHLMGSKLFMAVWKGYQPPAEAQGDDDEDEDEEDEQAPPVPPSVAHLKDRALVWRRLAETLAACTTPFVELQPLMNLVTKVELQVLNQTMGVDPEASSWLLMLSASDEWVESVYRTVKKFCHLHSVYEVLEQLPRLVKTFFNFVETSGHHHVKDVLNSIAQLTERFKSTPWENLTLADYERFHDDAMHVHPCLTRTCPDLFEAIVTAKELFEWLCNTPADTEEFSRGVQIAMGKTEMECPVELWVREPGMPGHPNEEVLSMLTTVHSYLHTLIYKSNQTFPTYKAFLGRFLKELAPSSEKTIVAVKTCVQLRTGLQSLLSDSDFAAIETLFATMDPVGNPRWICSTASDMKRDEDDDESPEECSLNLVWTARLASGPAQQRLSISELMDFQSTVVLSRASGRKQEQAVSKFVEQFGWSRELLVTLFALQQAGHFGFIDFHVEFPGTCDPEEIRGRVRELTVELENWEESVAEKRRNIPAFNYFQMRQAWTVVSALDGLCESMKSAERKDIIAAIRSNDRELKLLSSTMQCGVPRISHDADACVALVADMLKEWAVIRYNGDISDVATVRKNASAYDTLSAVSEVIQTVLATRPLQKRPIHVPSASDYSLGGNIGSGVHVLCSRSPEFVFEDAIAAYAHVGYLPEWHYTLVCRSTTSWEEVHMLILRWAQSSIAVDPSLFCLISVESLAFDVQRRAVLAIRGCSSQASNGLLLISGTADNQHILSQFAHCRITPTEIPPEAISSVGDQVSGTHSAGISVHTSLNAGAGKSFNIRTLAFESFSERIHLPIMHDCADKACTSTLLDRLVDVETLIDETGSEELFLFHIDVTSTTTADFSKSLFELIFMGGLINGKAGKQFFWNPSTTLIAVELASGKLRKSLAVCNILPQRVARLTADTLVVTEDDLRIGMGEEFETIRNDGTAVSKLLREAEEVVAANAYERIQYVCTALDLMERTNGRFPYVFSCGGAASDSDPLESLRKSLSHGGEEPVQLLPARCFYFLMTASKMDEDTASLWCLWSFVNVFYWQLRDIHSPESPINSACLPDGDGEARDDDIIVKEKIKGEVVNFLTRTAREFATRQQQQEVDLEELIGMRLGNFSARNEWNNMWDKCAFMNDGQFVYSLGDFYLYFREVENRWVVDDIVVPTGTVFAFSKQPTIAGSWSISSDWTPSGIQVARVAERCAYKGEALRVYNCPTTGSVGRTENGYYLRQPPYDDIDGHPHYIYQNTAEDYRRHIFWSSVEDRWQLCPVCNNEQGAFALSKTEDFTKVWLTIPPNVTEGGITANPVRRSDQLAFLSKADREAIEKQDKRKVEREEILSEVGEEAELDRDSTTAMKLLQMSTVSWNESNHECLLFSNQTHVVSFLSLDPRKMRASMHAGLLSYLEDNKINVGENLTDLNSRFHEILSSLTEVSKTREEASALMDGNYCLTGDALLKMLAVFVRIRCGVPVVLMGECGCGKTMLIKYVCAWLGVRLLILDVHGGTSEKDILEVFEKASAELASNAARQVFVFLDEVNTCAHMGLINDIICHRTIYGNRLAAGIQVLGALNPYRQRPERSNVPGLVFQLHGKAQSTPDPMSELVYRVHPIPATMQDFIFDFGSLEYDTEKLYIKMMVQKKLHNEGEPAVALISSLILESQFYIRKVERDPSSASLRDVKRCLDLIVWFLSKVTKRKAPGKAASSKSGTLSTLAMATVLGLAFVYYYRLSKVESRQGYWYALRFGDVDWKRRGLVTAGMKKLGNKGVFEARLKAIQKSFCENVEVEKGIAMNDALMENLFVTIICILNKIPVFVVGKPGSSKTLTMQVIASNLQGKRSTRPFWRKFPAVYIFQYQCSPMSDSHSIQHQFDMAVRYQEHAKNAITILLLDEVGLAEHSPEMPLKVLHAMLVDPPIAIVGLSNWALDPAKMNRAICLQRTEPTTGDIKLTGERILNTKIKELADCLGPLAKAYHSIYVGQQGRDFVGMRDYYNLIKLLRSEFIAASRRGARAAREAAEANEGETAEGETAEGETNLTDHVEDVKGAVWNEELLTFALARNFGGKPELLQKVVQQFSLFCFKRSIELADVIVPPVTQLVRANLDDLKARHLMVLTKNGSALQLLFGCGILDRSTTKVLVGSEFKEDKTELHLVNQINEVKLAMASGSTLVLLNHDNIYEALYDVLNQRYLYKTDADTGKMKKMLRLAIGSRSQLCPVKDTFKIVVVVEQDHAYRSLDLPLLNRFEKQVLLAKDILGTNGYHTVEALQAWTEQVLSESGMTSIQDVFGGFHPGLLASAVLTASQFDDSKAADVLETVKLWLLRIAQPISMAQSSLLHEVDAKNGGNTFETLNCFASAVKHGVIPDAEKAGRETASGDSAGALASILTHSPGSHMNAAQSKHVAESTGMTVNVVQLSDMSSETNLRNTMRDFFTDSPPGVSDGSKDTMVIIQCDPIVCKQSLIDHARDVCVHERERALAEGELTSGAGRRHLVFLIHLPLGVRQRMRHFAVDMYAPWSYYFVDDIRYTPGGADIKSLVSSSVFELDSKGLINVRELVPSMFQASLSTCTVPGTDSEESTFRFRITSFHKLLQDDTVKEYLLKQVREVLRANKEPDEKGVHSHVKILAQQLGGSLRQSMLMAIENVVTQATAIVLRYLDKNFNTALLYREVMAGQEAASSLWMKLATSSQVVSSEALSFSGRVTEHVEVEGIDNTGKSGPLVARFPFSFVFIAALEKATTRDLVMGTDEDAGLVGIQKLQQVFASSFSKEVSEWVAAEQGDGYLEDMVSSVAALFGGLSHECRFKVYTAVLKTWMPKSFSTIAGSHVGLWSNEARLFNYCSMLAAVPASVRDEAIAALEKASAELAPASVDETDAAARAKRLSSLDELLVSTLLNGVVNKVHALFNSGAVKGMALQLASHSLVEVISRFHTALCRMVATLKESSTLAETKRSQGVIEVAILMLRLVFGEVDTCNVALKDIKSATRLVLDSYVHHSVAYITSATGVLLKTCNVSERVEVQAISCATNFFVRLCFHALDNCREAGVSVPVELQELLVGWLNADKAVLKKYALSEAIEPTMAHCRLVLERLVALELDGSLQLISSPRVAGLYLNLFLDLMEDGEWQRALDKAAVQKLVLHASGKVDLNCSRGYIEAVAAARAGLEVYARRLLIALSEERKAQKEKSTPAVTVQEAGTPELLELVLANRHAAVYVMKLLKNFFGVEAMCEVAVLPQATLPWLPHDSAKAKEMLSKPRLFDAMTYVAGEKPYAAVCKAVQVCLSKASGAHSELNKLFYGRVSSNELDQSIRSNAEPLLIAATFSQFTRMLSAIDQGSSARFTSWLSQYSDDPLRSPLFKRFMRWQSAPSTRAIPLVPMDTPHEEMLVGQVGLHLAAFVTTHSSCWMAKLIADPSSMLLCYLPSMPGDPMAEAMRALGGRLGWYRCPNGHPYTVGECTMPMQTARCIQCGVIIGGRNHVSVKGVTRMNRVTANPPQGYCVEPGVQSQENTVSLAIARFFVHLAIHIACVSAGNPQDRQSISQLASKKASFTVVKNTIESRLIENWKSLKDRLQVGSSDLALTIHLILRDMAETSAMVHHPSFHKYQERDKWEGEFARLTSKILHGGHRSILASAESALRKGNEGGAYQAALGPSLWAAICETEPPACRPVWTPSLDDLQWRFRSAASFNAFQVEFLSNADSATAFPLLAAFLAVEERIPLIQYLSSILSWHAVLFEVFPADSISREEALCLTNADVIERLPPHRREAAELVLEEFCKGFNLALPQIELLFQCEPNPFRTATGKVDLSGTGQGEVRMDRSTPITFSLPSAIQGIVDAPGLCTIKILELLQQTHNSVLEALKGSSAEKAESGLRAMAAAAARQEDTSELPSINYLTPPAAVRQQLVVYSREKDFLPLLRAFSTQPVAMASSGQAYDLAGLEGALQDHLLAGVQPVAAHVRHFQFRGDMKQAGRLAGLRQILEQRSLASHTLNALWGEVDTQHHLLQILRIVEMCINFLVMTGDTTGAGKVDATILFSEYVTSALLVDATAWEELSTPTIAGQVQLCHLQALFMALEERMHGNPFDDAVSEEFRKPLTADLERMLNAGLAFYDVDLLLPVLRDFMLENLRHCAPELELKEYLEYQHDDLIDLEWFQNYFPDALLLAHSYETFQWLTNMTSAAE